MNRANKVFPVIRWRAVWLVREHRGEYPPLWAAVELIAPAIGCAFHTSPESVKREGLSTIERKGLKALEHENK
jgi:transposase